MFGGVDLSTVDPNPTVMGYGDQSATDLSQMMNTAGQWGATIASIVTNNPVSTVATPNGVRTIGAYGSQMSYPSSAMGSGPTLLLLAVVVIAAVLLMKDA